MSDPNTLELLSSSSSDEAPEDCATDCATKSGEEERNHPMGNCLGGGGGGDGGVAEPARTRKRRQPSPPPPPSPPRHGHPRPLPYNGPDVQIVSDGAGDRWQQHQRQQSQQRRNGGPPPTLPHRRGGSGSGRGGGGGGEHDAAFAHTTKESSGDSHRNSPKEREFVPLYVESSSSSSGSLMSSSSHSSSSNSSSSSSFFSSYCPSSIAVRAPPPPRRRLKEKDNDGGGGVSGAQSTGPSGGSSALLPSSLAATRGSMVGSLPSSVLPPPMPPSRKRAKGGRRGAPVTRHETIDLTGIGGDSDGGAAEMTVKTGEDTAAARDRGGRKRRHRASAASSAVVERRSRSSSVARIPLGDGVDDSDEIDVAIVTDGIMLLVNGLGIPRAATCTLLPSGTPSYPDEGHSSSHLARRPLHYQQRDRWSCGFRNLQMMLSSLLARMPSEHRYFGMTVRGSGSTVAVGGCEEEESSAAAVDRSVPSLYRLQTFLEWSWAEGFDPRGARHFDHRIRGRTGRSSWIGAVEVSSVLSYLGVDSVVVQFIQKPASRALLGDFVRSYFERKAGYDGCYACWAGGSAATTAEKRSGGVLSSTEVAGELLQFASMRRESGSGGGAGGGGDVAVECCSCPIPPLYLQWEGHSVTVVGCSERRVPKNGAFYDLLIFDPMKSGSGMKTKINAVLTEAKKRPGRNWRNSLFADLSQLRDLRAMTLSTKDLLRLDCQIVLSSPRPLSWTERLKCREKVNALTAAEIGY